MSTSQMISNFGNTLYIYMYVHICTHMHVCICVYIYTYMYVYTYIYTYIYIHTYIYIYIYIRFICTFLTKAACCRNIEIVLHTTTLSIYIYIHIYICTHIYICIYICVYILRHIYILRRGNFHSDLKMVITVNEFEIPSFIVQNVRSNKLTFGLHLHY